MEARSVALVRGWGWLIEGFALFRRNPAIWMVLTLTLVLLWLGSLFIPVLGPLLFSLLSPVFFAGLMLGCRSLEQHGILEPAHLFAGFRHQAAPLVTVGGVYLVGTIIVFGLVLLTSGGAHLPALPAKPGTDVEAMREAMREMALALAVGAAAYLPLLMLIWFAPLLVALDRVAPLSAMKLSFVACLRNGGPFLVYGIAVLGLWFVLSIPSALGTAGSVAAVALLMASIPVLICSIYVSYKDIFFVHTPPGGSAAQR